MKKKTKKLVGVYKMFVGDNVYIGASRDLKIRWKEHRYTMRVGKHRNPNVQRICNEFGWEAFQFEVLEYCQKRSLDKKEQYWINKLKPNLNSVLIVGSFVKQTEEQLQKKRDAICVKVYQYNLKGEFIKEWEGIVDAAKATGARGACISKCAKGKGYTAAGFMWRYEYSESIEPYENRSILQKVNVYNRNGKLIHASKTIEELSEILDATCRNIISRIKQRTLLHKKYLICYQSEEFNLANFVVPEIKKFYLYRAGDFEFHDALTMKQMIIRFGMKKPEIYLHLNSESSKPYKRFYLRKSYCGEKLDPLSLE